MPLKTGNAVERQDGSATAWSIAQPPLSPVPGSTPLAPRRCSSWLPSRRSAHQGGAANAYTFIWDGHDLINEYVSGGLSTRYAVLDGEVLARKQGLSRYVFVPDPLGSVHHLLNSNLNKAATMVYWPYGELQSLTGVEWPIQFVGGWGYYTAVANRAYVRARWLRPDLGRWQTVDPVFGPSHSYGYCYADPTSQRDPTGLRCETRRCWDYRDPCDYWRQHDTGETGPRGLPGVGCVICCKGRAYGCTKVPIPRDGIGRVFEECTLRHERRHARDIDCRGIQHYGCMDLPAAEAYRSECAAYQVSAQCDRDTVLPACARLPKPQRAACEHVAKLAYCCDCYYASVNCKKAGEPLGKECRTELARAECGKLIRAGNCSTGGK